MSEKEVVNRKLRNERQFFDSADYFRQLQGLRDAPVAVPDAPNSIFFFTRTDEGKLVRRVEPFSNELIQSLAVPSDPKEKKPRFDSADWMLSLHGVLEYPAGSSRPLPFMARFSPQDVAVVAHPTHERALSPEQLEDIAMQADKALRQKYGKNSPSKMGVLKLKLKGRTPHDQKQEIFDSADWSLRLQNVIGRDGI